LPNKSVEPDFGLAAPLTLCGQREAAHDQRWPTVESGWIWRFIEMPVYFVQHGVALPEEIDSNRPLSAEGRKEVEAIVAHLRKVGVRVNKVCHSGKTRAEQTAQILASEIGDGNLQEVPGMNPNDNIAAFAAALTEDKVMYVGHLPHLGKLVSYLVAGNETADVLTFVNGGVVCLARDGAGCHIQWYLIPSLSIAQ
jgi:phosphohistidine phosphatase